jgi:hypothetical protein
MTFSRIWELKHCLLKYLDELLVFVCMTVSDGNGLHNHGMKVYNRHCRSRNLVKRKMHFSREIYYLDSDG